MQHHSDLATLAILAASGALVGIGKSLIGTELLTLRLVLGRAIVTSGLGVSAGAVLAFIPELPFLGLIGIACAISSLGLSGLEILIDKWLKRNNT